MARPTRDDVPDDTTLSIPTPGIADPAPLGLAGFSLTTVLLSALNAGLIKVGSGELTFVGMALFYGGLGQFMAGMWEFKRNNTFGATAFGSFGAFWMGLGIVFVFGVLGHLGATSPFYSGDGTIWFLFLWAIFTTYMLIASLRVSGAIALVFLLLALTFFALWIGALNGSAFGSGFTDLGGWLGIATGIVAFYTSFAGVTNLTWGREVLPTFPMNRPLLKRG